jgi:hypothetical protein
LNTNSPTLADLGTKLSPGGLSGFRIEYIDSGTGNIISNLFSTVAYSNRCEAVSQPSSNSTQKSVLYRLTDSGSLLFLSVTPSTSPSIKPNGFPYVGVAGQDIILSNSYFDPQIIEIELTEYDLKKIALLINGERTLNIESGIENIYNEDKEIIAQSTLYDIKDEFNNPLYKVKQNNRHVEIPWHDNNCISEITSDYYAVVWDEQKQIIKNELIVTRAAIRAKIYYKRGYMQGNKAYFPWLVDQSNYLNTRYLMYIDGKSTYLYNNLLIQFDSNVYTDLDEPFETIIRMRAYDLNYPKFSKFINKVLLYYYRGPKQPLDIEIKLYNEAGYLLLQDDVKDKKILHDGSIINDSILGSSIVESKTFNLAYKFPLLLSDCEIKINNTSDFSLSSITYNYTVATTPELTRPEVYKNIIRVGSPILLTRESLLEAGSKEEAETITVLTGGKADDFN